MFGGFRGLLEQESTKPKSAGETLMRLAGYFRPYWLVLLLVLVMMIGNAWVNVISPVLTGQAVDCYMTPAVVGVDVAAQATDEAGARTIDCLFAVPENPTRADLLSGLLKLVLTLVGLNVLGSLTGGSMFYLTSWAGNHVLRHLQVEVFHKLQQLSLGYYSRNESGQLMSRITNDASTIQQAVSFALVQVLSSILVIVWIAYTMITYNWAYGLLSLAVVPLMAITTVWFSEQARRAFRRTRQEIGNVNAELEEGISGVREVQAFSRESANIENFRQSNAANRDANIRAVAYTSALGPTLEALGYAALAIVAGVGGYFLLQDQTLGGAAVTLGLIVTYINYVQRFNQPIQQISVLWTNLQSAIAGAERIFQLIDEQPDIVELSTATEMPPIQGNVVYDHVWAEYVPGEPVLKDVNLTATAGQTIAIVGPTGAGKTTLVNLLPRFYDATKGKVLIDGIDVSQVKLDSLRRQIGLVLQDTFLFSESVMENIRYGRPDASDEEVIAAAKLAQAHDFIERLPEGYNTILGERGGGLSQGQRQLLAIARAALADPRILILDEATSSVDTRTERLIQAALEKLLAGRTSFVIAHRLSTIRNADVVLVLRNGEIVERGRHEELLAMRGVYYDLYMSQFRRQEEVVAASQNGATGDSAVILPAS
jgi:ATP-binding cassette subfamily B multidrug efflux pump